MKKRFLFTFLLFVIFTSGVFSQENDTSRTKLLGEPFHFAKSFDELKNQINFSLQMGPSIYINTQSTLVSAPSPILFPVSLGVIWPSKSFLSVQPTVSFFVMHYLWYEGKALPAEIENRTATAHTLFLNIPATLSFFTSTCKIQLSAGAGFMLRIINLSLDVKPVDTGYSGSAQSDVNLISDYLWSGARFLYLTTEISCLFNITRFLKTGPVFGLYLPLGSFFNKEGFAGFMGYTGIKITL